jgi:Ras family protein T1
MTTFTSPKTTLEYLAYLGFESLDGSPSTTPALKVTKPRKRRRKPPAKVSRSVIQAHVLGAPHSGKSSLLDAFLSRPFSPAYRPTITPRVVVNTVELPGGRQVYLILNELGEAASATLDNAAKLLNTCDVVVYVYDSSDPESFAYIPAIREKHPHLEDLPSVFVALKADLDRTTQRGEVQPDEYTREWPQGVPVHTSVRWEGIGEVFVKVAEGALEPGTAMQRRGGEDEEGWWARYAMGGAVGVCAVAAAVVVWRRAGLGGWG